MRATVKGQLVSVRVLREKNVIGIPYVLVVYKNDIYEGATFLYTLSKTKWMRKSKLIEN